MNVLIGCEFSGTVREAFRKKGINAYSCDLLPCDDNSKHHYQADIFEALKKKKWDMLIAHPPCTYLCNSGVCWLYKKKPSGKGSLNPVKFTKEKNIERWEKMKDGANFFKELLNYPIDKIAIENPIMHKYAVDIIGRRQNQIIQPWQFGHGETKATCLWLKNLPELKPTKIVNGREQRVHNLPPSKDRWKLRSITYQGIADAMAEQWGCLL